jgi:hypothetical protein
MYIIIWDSSSPEFFTDGGPWNYWSYRKKDAVLYHTQDEARNRLKSLNLSDSAIKIEYIHPLNIH